MKKALTLIAFVALASVALSSTLFTAKDPKPGVVNIKGNANGRIASIDVFSTVPDGTVSISRLFNYSNYTNAYDITTREREVVSRVPVYDEYRMVRNDGEIFTYLYTTNVAGATFEYYGGNDGGRDAKLFFVTNPQGIYHNNKWYYDDGNMATAWDFYESAESGRDVQTIRLQKYQGGAYFDKYTFSREGTHIGSYNYVTNTVTTVTTNQILKVKTHDLAVTNVIYSGTCTNNCLHGVPNDVWLFSSDKLIFDGTATGGELRIVIE